jgi:hypothetical protein
MDAREGNGMAKGGSLKWMIVACLAMLPFGPALAQPSGTQRPTDDHVADGLLARHGAASNFEPVTFQPKNAPFPLRHNNYVGIKRPGTHSAWPGQTGADQRQFAMFDDPADSIQAFIELLRTYQDRYGDRSARAIFRHLSPPGDCSGAPQRHAGRCPENDRQPPVSAVRAAAAAGRSPEQDLQLFDPSGKVNDASMRAVLDAAVTQEVGVPYCPQPPRGESWLGCRVDDSLYQRALALYGKRQ